MEFKGWRLIVILFSSAVSAAEPDFHSRFLTVGLSRSAPAFTVLTVDSLGQGKGAPNPVLARTSSVAGLVLEGSAYKLYGKPVWSVTWTERTLILSSDHVAGVVTPPFTLTLDQKLNHATLLGLMTPGEQRTGLPCVLHLPDMGSLRITCNLPGAKLDYDACGRKAKTPYVHVAFPAATAQHPHVGYRLEVAAIHPEIPGLENDPLYDGFRHDWLNIFQVNPRLQMLANNAASAPCAFTLFEYSDLAVHTPPLVDGLTANDLIRMTLDRYLKGALGYGQSGFGGTPNDADLLPTKTAWTTLDTLPSFLISACNYVNGSGDLKWRGPITTSSAPGAARCSLPTRTATA